MISKSIQLTKADYAALKEIIDKNPRIEKGMSEALRICYEDATANIPNWKEVIKKSKSLDYPHMDEFTDKKVVTFVVDENIFTKVYESIKNQLRLSRPRVSYVTRLCIQAAWVNLSADKEEILKPETSVVVGKSTTDGIVLIRKFAELFENETEETQMKILQIKRILED